MSDGAGVPRRRDSTFQTLCQLFAALATGAMNSSLFLLFFAPFVVLYLAWLRPAYVVPAIVAYCSLMSVPTAVDCSRSSRGSSLLLDFRLSVPRCSPFSPCRVEGSMVDLSKAPTILTRRTEGADVAVPHGCGRCFVVLRPNV